MTHEDFMKLAIIMASKTQIEVGQELNIPKVGAVVVVGGEVIAMASRGKDDHAEKIALEEAVKSGATLANATVYTTLEPCVSGTRRKTLDACSDRLADHGVKRVVIGMHDPNREVTGKGFLRLQQSNIATELFPEELAQKIRVLNQDFIRGQQSLGIEIDYPIHGQNLCTAGKYEVILKGRWVNCPDPFDSVKVFVARANYWWPQPGYIEPITNKENEWSIKVYTGIPGNCRVIVGKLNSLGKALLKYYDRVAEVNQQTYNSLRDKLGNDVVPKELVPFVGIEMENKQPPKGIDVEHEIEFEVID